MAVEQRRFTASNYYISQFYRLAQSRGLDADGLLKAVSINPDIIDKPGRRVDAEKLGALVRQIWIRLGDEAMSLGTSPIPPGTFHMMGKLAIHEPNLSKALSVSRRFLSMVTDAFMVKLEVSGRQAVLKFWLRDQSLDHARLLAEEILMASHRFSSWLVAENIPMTQVFFDYPVPAQVAEYQYLFPGKHTFDAPFFGFSFPSSYLQRGNVRNLASLDLFMRRCPVEFFLQPQMDFSISAELELLLRRRMAEGPPSIETAADILHMTKRTLIRRLKEEGTSYQKLKDRVRREKAIRLLATDSIGVSAVAERLGYSDSAVFARAFKAWTGSSPKAYRAKVAQEYRAP